MCLLLLCGPESTNAPPHPTPPCRTRDRFMNHKKKKITEQSAFQHKKVSTSTNQQLSLGKCLRLHEWEGPSSVDRLNLWVRRVEGGGVGGGEGGDDPVKGLLTSPAESVMLRQPCPLYSQCKKASNSFFTNATQRGTRTKASSPSLQHPPT